MKIVSIIGVRPNFVKEFVIHRACQSLGVEEVIVHTGQHYDYQMSEVFFGELKIPKPKYHLNLTKQSPVSDIASIMPFIVDVLKRERPDLTLVYGDVDSTLAASLASAKIGIPVAHIEAGVRSHSFYNPEELNREVTDVVSQYLFPHIPEAYDALIRENFDPSRVFLCGDVVKDALMQISEEHQIKPHRGDYHLLTVHRMENTDSPHRMASIVRAILDSGANFKFPVHPRTHKCLQEYGLMKDLRASNRVELLEPQGYLDFAKLLAGANKVLSVSGGVRREAYIFGKPVISLIDIVWVKQMIDVGWKRVADADYERIVDAVQEFDPSQLPRPEIFGDGKAAHRIMATLKQRIEERTHKTVPIGDNQRAPAPTSVSVVIPVFNEIESIPALFRKLSVLSSNLVDPSEFELEFLFVNDGSNDGSLEALECMKNLNARHRIISHSENRGLGAAIRTGLVNAGGELIVTIDADSNYDHYEIPKILRSLTPDYDMVTASPFMKKNSWNYPFHRYVMSRCVVTLYRIALQGKGSHISTFTSGFRVYRRSRIRELLPKANDFLSTAEILTTALVKEMKVKEFYAIIYNRDFGRSKLKTLRTIRAHLGLIFKLFFSKFDFNYVRNIGNLSAEKSVR